jgi:hypothetical protein
MIACDDQYGLQAELKNKKIKIIKIIKKGGGDHVAIVNNWEYAPSILKKLKSVELKSVIIPNGRLMW